MRDGFYGELPVDIPQEIPSGPGGVWGRTGWWTRETSLGGQVERPFPPNAGLIYPIGGIDALGPPMPYTLTLSRTDTYEGQGLNCDVRALVTVGIGAITQNIVCDWIHGTQIGLAGSGAVRVSAQAYAPIPEVPYNAGASRTVLTAGIGMTVGAHPQPRFTLRQPPLEALAVGPSIAPPQWAESLLVQLSADQESADNPYNGEFFADWRGPNGSHYLTVPIDDPVRWMPVPAASYVRVRSTAAAISRIPTLIWRLAL